MTVEGFSQWVRNPQNGSNTPPLNAVLFVGNDPNLPDTGGGIVVQPIQAATVDGGTGASSQWLPGIAGGIGGTGFSAGGNGAAGQDGGASALQGGSGDAGGGLGSFVVANPGKGDDTPGRVSVLTDGSTGTAGQALVADGAGGLVYGGAGGPAVADSQTVAYNYSGNLFSPVPAAGHTYMIVAEMTTPTDDIYLGDVFAGSDLVCEINGPVAATPGSAARVFGNQFSSTATFFAVILTGWFRLTSGSPVQLTITAGGSATAGAFVYYLVDYGVLFP